MDAFPPSIDFKEVEAEVKQDHSGSRKRLWITMVLLGIGMMIGGTAAGVWASTTQRKSEGVNSLRGASSNKLMLGKDVVAPGTTLDIPRLRGGSQQKQNSVSGQT